MADSSVAITAGSGTPIRVLTGLGAGVADQQVVTLADQYGNITPAAPDGTFQVDNGASSLLFDAFDNGLTQWTSGGTPGPTVANGLLTFNASTGVSMYSWVQSASSLPLNAESYLHIGWVVQLDTTTTLTNSTRWWGWGANNGTTPTASAPVLNGAVFMLDYAAGNFYAAIYSSGVRTQSVQLTKPTDGAFHRYQIQFRTTRAYFIIDGVTVATIQNPNPTVTNNQYLIAGGANSAAVGSAPTLVASVASAADGASNHLQLADGVTPSIHATIKKSSTAALGAADTALVVQAMPVPTQLVTAVGAAAATAVTLTIPAPAFGLRHYITGIWFERYITVATTGAASGYLTSTANSNLVFNLPSDTQAIGSVNMPIAISFSNPVATSATQTNTTFTAPAVTGTIYRITATYFTAP